MIGGYRGLIILAISYNSHINNNVLGSIGQQRIGEVTCESRVIAGEWGDCGGLRCGSRWVQMARSKPWAGPQGVGFVSLALPVAFLASGISSACTSSPIY